MGTYTIAPRHLRFAIKLACAVVLALFVGFHFQLETPRWAVLTAAIVAAGPAFAAGGEPYSGAIRYRGMLRIAGTFIGCIAALVIIILMIRAPLLMMLVCCLWAGFCTWVSSLVKVENSYAWGLAGYTALIIIITIHTNPMLAPQFAVERCSEIVIGIVSAIVADLLFSPRSIKKEIDLELDNLLIAQYKLMQLCVAHGEKEEVDQAWGALVRRTTALEGMRSNLIMESSRWAKANQRLKAINTLSLTLITQACETYLIQNSRPEMVTDDYRELFAEPVETVQDVHQQLKRMRRFLTWKGEHNTPVTIYSWVGAATRYLLLKRGVVGNTKISRIEDGVLRGETVVKVESAERHHAMAHLCLLYSRNAILAVDGLDLRQRRDGNDRRGYRAGDAPAKPAYGGDRLPLWHPGGVTVGHLVLPGDHAGDAAEHAVALHQPGGNGVLYRDRSAKKASRIAGGAGEHHQHSGAG